jgi:hypothetical protein
MLNEQSLADTYILYDFFMNFHPSGEPVYIRAAKDGKLLFSPVWRFDDALDNGVSPMPRLEERAAALPWIGRLLQNRNFIEDVYRQRYYELLRTALDPQRIQDLVDNTARYLGPALLRDWKRWERLYTTDALFIPQPEVERDGTKLIRQTFSYDQELVKIRYLLREHDADTRNEILEMRWQPHLLNSSQRIHFNMLVAMAFITAFFIIIALIRKSL